MPALPEHQAVYSRVAAAKGSNPITGVAPRFYAIAEPGLSQAKDTAL